jgi:hypothetical protein
MGRGLIEIEKQIFADVFSFLKDNIDVRQDQEYWKDVVEQAVAIERKYLGNKFAVNMLYACTQRLCELFDGKEKL